ncbi:MAG: toll/interleukin-1 receptor domain-containing protein, partial [Thermoanaerobaculia bacterium]
MTRSRIFVSYSHKDAEALEQLQRFLKTLERDGRVDAWADTRLQAGDEWRPEIEAALDRATAAILLISQDFLASDFIFKEEIPRILSRAAAGELTVIPVFLSPSNVDDLEFPFSDPDTDQERRLKLTTFQGFGTPTRPLSEGSWSDRERIYAKLSRRLEELRRSPLGPQDLIEGTQLIRWRMPMAASPPAHEYELTVELDLRGGALEAKYHLPGREPIA